MGTSGRAGRRGVGELTGAAGTDGRTGGMRALAPGVIPCRAELAGEVFASLVPVGNAFWPPAVVAELRRHAGASLERATDAELAVWVRGRADVLSVGWGAAMRLDPAACPDGLAAHPAARLFASRLRWECDDARGRKDVELVVEEQRAGAPLSAAAEARLRDAVLSVSSGFRAALWVRFTPGVYGRETVPADADEATLLQYAGQRAASGLSVCLHSGPLRAIYLEPDGSTRVAEQPPNAGRVLVDDELLARCLRRGILPGEYGWSPTDAH